MSEIRWIKGYFIIKDRGYYRLLRGGAVVIDDPACEDLNKDRFLAELYFSEYLRQYAKWYWKTYKSYEVAIIEDSKWYHIDFKTGLGEGHYLKKHWDLMQAIQDQYDKI